MKTIEYRVQYTGNLIGQSTDDGASYEIVRVRALNINTGYSKALKRALQPLGNGRAREIGGIEFWAVK